MGVTRPRNRVPARIENAKIGPVLNVAHRARRNELLVLGIEGRRAGIERMLQIDALAGSIGAEQYAFAAPRSDMPDRFGLLIYTAGAGAQGTLGGLVEIAGRIPDILRAALDRMQLCSNDPVCADHDPSVTGDERSLNGAACHACLLIAETSCEARNVYLDRALLVETVAQTGAGLF